MEVNQAAEELLEILEETHHQDILVHVVAHAVVLVVVLVHVEAHVVAHAAAVVVHKYLNLNIMKSLLLPPENLAHRDFSLKYVFLAGTIDMGQSEDWQTLMSDWFLTVGGWGVFNPRRRDWDSTWLQDHSNPAFSQQVRWEINAMDKSDLILMYFAPSSKSPISLLELGMHLRSKKLHVVCPPGFYRKGNVDIVCDLFNIPLYESFNQFKDFLIKNE